MELHEVKPGFVLGHPNTVMVNIESMGSFFIDLDLETDIIEQIRTAFLEFHKRFAICQRCDVMNAFITNVVCPACGPLSLCNYCLDRHDKAYPNLKRKEL